MLRLVQVFDAILFAPAEQVLEGVALVKVQMKRVDDVERLHPVTIVMGGRPPDVTDVFVHKFKPSRAEAARTVTEDVGVSHSVISTAPM